MGQQTHMELVFNKNVAIGKKVLTQWIFRFTYELYFRQYMNRKGGFNRPLDPIA
jgi:hypothetical protein